MTDSNIMTDSDIVVTDNSPRQPRPDTTEDQLAAEVRADKIIEDFGKGFLTKRTCIKVRDAAERAISGHNLSHGIGRM